MEASRKTLDLPSLLDLDMKNISEEDSSQPFVAIFPRKWHGLIHSAKGKEEKSSSLRIPDRKFNLILIPVQG